MGVTGLQTASPHPTRALDGQRADPAEGETEPLVTLPGLGMTSCLPPRIQLLGWLLFSTPAPATRVCDSEGDLLLVRL